MTTPNTVKVRIAVAVDSEGNRICHQDSSQSDEANMEHAVFLFHEMFDPVGDVATRIVVAEVPLPAEGEEVVGEVGEKS